MGPLFKRLPREFRANLGKYLGVFLLMTVSIALTSGFLLAAHSIEALINGMRDEYTIEDGRFTTSFEATDEQLDAAADAAAKTDDVTIYENYSFDADYADARQDGTRRFLRTYIHRTQVDIAAYAQGRVPEAADEVAVDRVFAKNNDVELGDTVELEGREFTVVGIMTQPDSQALFSDNSSFTVNTLTYGVAEVSEKGFDALLANGANPAYTYSFVFADRPLSVADRTDAEKDMVEALAREGATVQDLLDADANQGIGYASDDVKGDSSMWSTLLDIIIVIMAFIFVVLTSGTIEEESAVIGTLLASGYRRRELILHYMALPTLVGVLAAVLGSAAGVAFTTEPMRNPYSGSYSLPPFKIDWSWSIFISTAAIPVLVLVGITFLGLVRKMGKTPLQFLRHETGKSGVKRGFNLPERMGFVARFRVRVFLRNIGNFVTLFLGIGFASMLLLFGLAVLPTMEHYADNLHNNMVAEHQYTLKAPLELSGSQDERDAWKAVDALQDVDQTKVKAVRDAADELQDAADALSAVPSAEAMQSVQDAQDTLNANLDNIASDLGKSREDTRALLEDAQNAEVDDDDVHPVNTQDNSAAAIEQAEKYAVYTLQYDRGDGKGTESITVYGVDPDSSYWKDLDVTDGRVVFGRGLIDKFGFTAGSKVKLYDKYEDESHTVTLASDTDVWGTRSDMSIYMSRDSFNELFDKDDAYFNGYASDKALNLDSRYVASELTPDDMDAIGDQFVTLMGDMIGMLVGLAIFIFLIFMYLLTKAVIDRSARSISYMKVFGYTDREISKLYIRSITICVCVALVLCQPVIIGVLTMVFRAMLAAYNGNIEIYVPPVAIVKTVAAGFATYLVVALLHLRAIKRVPLSEALKVQE